MTSSGTIDTLFGTAAGDDLSIAWDCAAAVANDTGVRQRVALCVCDSSGRHFSYRPVDVSLDVVDAELVVVAS